MDESRRYPWGALLGAAAVSLYLVYHFRQALIPFFLSFALAYFVNPAVNIFEARGLKREFVVTLLYALIASLISIGVNSLLPRITAELALLQGQSPLYVARARQYWTNLETQAIQHLPVGKNLIQQWSFQMYNPVVSYLQRLPGYLLNIFPLLSLIFLVPFISFYLLMDSSKLTRHAIQVCPSRYVEQALHLLSEIDASLGRYVRGILIEASTVGIVSYIGLWALDLNYALAVATIAGLSSLVPYAGPILGATIGAVIALVQFHDLWMVAKVAGLFFAIRGLDDLFLQPTIARHSIRLHPLVYLLALMIGAEAFGFVGLLLGVPAACVVKALVGVLWDWYATEPQGAHPRHSHILHVPYV